MKTGRRMHDAQFKGRVALEAARGLKTMAELASEFEVHPARIAKWKRQLLEGGATSSRDGERRGRKRRRSCEPGCISRSGGCRWSWTGLKKAGLGG
jgi:transposase-like protein